MKDSKVIKEQAVVIVYVVLRILGLKIVFFSVVVRLVVFINKGKIRFVWFQDKNLVR